jgi:hypothetical protein
MHNTNNPRIERSPTKTPIVLPSGPEPEYPIAYNSLPIITPNPNAAAGSGKYTPAIRTNVIEEAIHYTKFP